MLVKPSALAAPSLTPGAAALPATRLLLIRHAEVEARYQGVFGGRIDMELSPRGHEQAAALAKCLYQKPLSAIYASPMKRVQQTLAPLLANGAPKPVILPDLREVDFGDWTGLAWEEVQEKFGINAFSWLEQLECNSIANAECAETLQDRVEPCLQQILAAYSGQQVAVFCHGGIIRVLLGILLRWPLPPMGAFEIDYASLTQVLVLPQKAELQLLNFTPWREIAS
jgi:broad specificity phosphatase PhoE